MLILGGFIRKVLHVSRTLYKRYEMYVVLNGWNISVVSGLLQIFVSSSGAIVGRSIITLFSFAFLCNVVT